MKKLFLILGAVAVYCWFRNWSERQARQTRETLKHFKAQVQEDVRQQIQAGIRQIQQTASTKS